jgi:hypothetical protein
VSGGNAIHDSWDVHYRTPAPSLCRFAHRVIARDCTIHYMNRYHTNTTTSAPVWVLGECADGLAASTAPRDCAVAGSVALLPALVVAGFCHDPVPSISQSIWKVLR